MRKNHKKPNIPIPMITGGDSPKKDREDRDGYINLL